MAQEIEADDSLFEIGELDEDEASNHLEHHKKQNEEQVAKSYSTTTILDNKKEKAVGATPKKPFKMPSMRDPCFEPSIDYTPTVQQPQYQPILASGDDEEEEEKPRNMLGYAAYHGPRFVPAEVKDNVEHFMASTPTAAPRLSVPRPRMDFGHLDW